MMDEINYERIQEDIGLGIQLMEDVAAYFGLASDATEDQIRKALYKGTTCGAWIQFTETGLVVGSIVEGSDVDVASRTLRWTGEEDVSSWLSEVIEAIEEEADAIWIDLHDYGGPDELENGG